MTAFSFPSRQPTLGRPPTPSAPMRLKAAILGLGLALLPVAAPHAALADIASTPVSAGTFVKPNLLFILDDSGSMSSNFMPDDMRNSTAYGYYSAQCNGLAYNPLITYTPPVNADGTAYPAASFTAAPNNGFDTSAGALDLGAAGANVYYTYSGTQAAMDWRYTDAGQVDTSTTFYAECMSTVGDTTSIGAGRFTAVTVAANSPQSQNYANWFAYYRTRQSLMRTAVGRAFQSLNREYRVGFTVISDPDITGAMFLNVQDFDADQKTRFYNLLYSAPSRGYTPLRGALSKAGRYYSRTISGQSYDPVQYSCQRHFTLLSTDGYWNRQTETTAYGPFQRDGVTEVGNQDGNEARPMRDSTNPTGGGDANTLADVAQYYWATDLRPELTNNVGATSNDSATHQHMNTFTLGLGVRGTLDYDRHYLTQTRGDYVGLKAGTLQWPVPRAITEPWTDGDATHVDDLWHTAINGRGQYFSALDPNALSEALSSTLSEIGRMTRTGAGAAASTLTPVSGDNWIFVPSYSNANGWHGDLRAFQFTIDVDGNLTAPDTSTGREIWSAASRLDTRTSGRKILFNGNGTLADFTYDRLSAAGLSSPFDNRCTTAAQRLTQCGSLTTNALAKVTGEHLVNYLRGDTSLYLSATTADNRVFRTRASRLGDFMGASPVYVGKPPYKYADAGYAAYVSAQSNRTKVVYAAANDGMLHAFKVGSGSGDDSGGTELWAFVPSAVIPELWRLADADYDGAHRYYVDATPNVADIWDGSRWRSILVGGLGGGGRSYYALDVTDPLNPALLWEFTDENLGYTYSNPVVTKNRSGTWVVAFTSGVNNVGPGDGVGRLYVVNALTGQPISALSTGAGSTDTPSSLGRLNAWVTQDSDNTALRFYAGDMLGYMWRFDPEDRVPPSGAEAVLLGISRSPSGAVQPIVGKPMLSQIKASSTGAAVAVVTWGTGRLLGNSDVTDTTVQSIYAVKDALDANGLGVLRNSSAGLVPLTLNASRQTEPAAAIDWATKNGWWVDLTLGSGERVNLDGTPLAEGVLAFASTLPSTDPCVTGGASYLYQFELTSGRVLNTPTPLPLLVGISRIISTSGKVSALMTTVSQQTLLSLSYDTSSSGSGVLRRSAWRELVD